MQAMHARLVYVPMCQHMIVTHIICICIIHKNCIILHYVTIYLCHFIENCAEFVFWNFCSLVENENTERPAFYPLLVTMVFLDFPQLKQLNKIKNVWILWFSWTAICLLLELEIQDSLLCLCWNFIVSMFLSFFLIMFSSTVVPVLQ